MSVLISPIHKLKHDILYHIFTLNADIFDRKDRHIPPDSPLRALTTTRFAAPACQEWRKIILGSTTLWARLVDLDLLQQEKDDWRDEIICRSGDTAPLWIRNTWMAMVNGMPIGVEIFLLRLLDEYWDRVQNLDIFVEDWAGLIAKHDQLCLRPAPSLQIFTVEMSKYHGHSIIPPSAPVLRLFADNAPSIKEFCTPRMPLDMRASWLSHLRKLTMFIPNDITPLFDALTTMPLLEEIDIVTAESSSIDFQNEEPFIYRKQISLPRLEMLAIKDSLRTCLAFAERITPRPGCSLHLEASYRAFAPLTLDLLPSIHKPISRYFSSYFECHKPTTNFEFRITDEGTMMQVFNLTESREFCFFFGITCEDGRLDREEVLRHLLSPFKSPVAPSHHMNVKGLVLKVHPSLASRTLSPLFDFLSSFNSVAMIKADNLTLDVYTQRRTPSSPILFPRLQTLVLEAGSDKPTSKLDIHTGVFAFLSERRHVGDKIRILDLTCWGNIAVDDMDVLIKGDLKDLATKVKWIQNGEAMEYYF